MTILRGVVHSQIGCSDFKSLKKCLEFLDFFRIFRIFLWVYQDFMNIKGFKHGNRGVVHSQIRCTDFKSSKKSFEFFDFFRIFRIFLGGVRGFFWVNKPSQHYIYLIILNNESLDNKFKRAQWYKIKISVCWENGNLVESLHSWWRVISIDMSIQEYLVRGPGKRKRKRRCYCKGWRKSEQSGNGGCGCGCSLRMGRNSTGSGMVVPV